MAENSAIGWTDSTFNSWVGCTEVGPGCDSCYARELDKRYQWGVPVDQRVKGVAPHWGVGAPRYRTSVATWRRVVNWNRDAEAKRRPVKVFCNSLSDVFDNEVPEAWRKDLFDLWVLTPWLRWIVVTKRVPNIRKMLPANWGTGYPNVGLVATVVDQDEYDRDAPRLMDVPARWLGFSMEPQLGRIILMPGLTQVRGTIWCITGGESAQPTSGKDPRPYDPAWAGGLMAASKITSNVRVFVKQLGARPVGQPPPVDGMGKDPRVWPQWLRVQQFPPEVLT